MKRYLPVLVTLMGILVLLACRKSMVDQPKTSPIDHSGDLEIADVPYPKSYIRACEDAPDYGGNLIFTKPSSTDVIISPINHPDSGQYFAWPKGMDIDRETGAINISRSEGGIRYDIGYVKKGTTDTCMQTLILGGASYQDSIYVLGDNERYAKPYYNADPNLTVMCTSSGGPNTCQYDLDNQAKNQGVKVDNNNGDIDLQNTLADAFGTAPANGTRVNTTIAYRLNDNSNLATQYVPITLVYYNNKTDIPADLLDLISQKKDRILNQALLLDIFNPDAAISRASPRPPIIIVTRFK